MLKTPYTLAIDHEKGKEKNKQNWNCPGTSPHCYLLQCWKILHRLLEGTRTIVPSFNCTSCLAQCTHWFNRSIRVIYGGNQLLSGCIWNLLHRNTHVPAHLIPAKVISPRGKSTITSNNRHGILPFNYLPTYRLVQLSTHLREASVLQWWWLNRSSDGQWVMKSSAVKRMSVSYIRTLKDKGALWKRKWKKMIQMTQQLYSLWQLRNFFWHFDIWHFLIANWCRRPSTVGRWARAGRKGPWDSGGVAHL